MAGKHTQGQWVAELETVDNGGWFEPDDIATIYCGEKIIATYSVSYGEYPESRDENEANAILISAAPDLLEACELALEYWYSDHPNDTADAHQARERIRAAIARATQPLPPPNEEV